VSVEAPEACPRYACRVIRGIDPEAATPTWMIEKLRRGGVRAISPVVDVTNYVMLELGQPMHGFDLARVEGGIRVRLAEVGEVLALLDGTEVKLTADTLVIADAGKPLALAGIMGGAESGVDAGTRDILLESAFFAPLAIAGKARSYGLHTDSSHRFERGVDPALQVRAIERATALLLDIVGGEAGPVVDVVVDEQLPVAPVIVLRRTRIARVLGIEIADADVVDILTRLGMTVEPADDGWCVTPPSSRFDVAIEVDLIEEIGRIYGYARIPESLTSAPVSVVTRPEAAFSLPRARQTLVERGYQEAITYSFISPELARLLDPQGEPITLANPISADMAVMRPNLWGGLLNVLRYNLARQQDRVRVFESGLGFRRTAGQLLQERRLAGLVCGPVRERQWGEPGRAVDFYDLKGDVEAILAQLGPPESFRFEPAEQSCLHPGQSAQVWRGEQPVGWLGLLHPALQDALDIDVDVLLFELSLDALAGGKLPAFQPLSKFPAIRRDIAITVARETGFSAVRACVERAAPAILRDIRLFDVYTGENIDSSLKSLALGLILQHSSHTLTDQEVEEAGAAILGALDRELGAKLRD
jgi:phenylalanyl-tRNA synthetase beta chain